MWWCTPTSITVTCKLSFYNHFMLIANQCQQTQRALMIVLDECRYAREIIATILLCYLMYNGVILCMKVRIQSQERERIITEIHNFFLFVTWQWTFVRRCFLPSSWWYWFCRWRWHCRLFEFNSFCRGVILNGLFCCACMLFVGNHFGRFRCFRCFANTITITVNYHNIITIFVTIKIGRASCRERV